MMLAIILTFSLLTVVNCNNNGTTEASTTRDANTTTAARVTTRAYPSTSTASVTTTAKTHANHSSDYWVVYYDAYTNKFCLIMDAVFVIKLVIKSQLPVTHWITIAHNTTANVTGKCGNDTNIITLWQENLQFSLSFSKNKGNTFKISSFELNYNDTVELNGTDILSSVNSVDSSKSYYTCDKNQTIFSDMNNTITVKPLKLEVFQSETMDHPNFSLTAVSCETTDNLIPIIVGAALGGLIVIVLIAYLIGRHRSRRGYESV